MKNIPMVVDVYRPKYARASKGYISTARKQGYRSYVPRSVPRAGAGYTRRAGFYGRFNGPSSELKFFDTALDFSADATGEVPATGQLNLIPQDATQSGRIGRKCTIRSIQIHGSLFYVPGANTNGTANVWIYMVQDTQCNGAAAAVTDVLTNGTTMQKALINMANSSRFKILKKWKLTFSAKAGVQTAFSRDCKIIEYYTKCEIPLEFDGTAATGAITTIRSNNVFLLCGTDGNSDDLVTMDGACRLRFSDS